LNWLTIILFLASVALRNPLLFLLAILLALVAGVTALWGRYALVGVTYIRRFGTARMFVGEETDLWIEVTNAKPLPLAWLKTSDEFPAEIELVRGTLQRMQHLWANVSGLRDLWFHLHEENVRGKE